MLRSPADSLTIGKNGDKKKVSEEEKRGGVDTLELVLV
jgi:hypothetical protein